MVQSSTSHWWLMGLFELDIFMTSSVYRRGFLWQRRDRQRSWQERMI